MSDIHRAIKSARLLGEAVSTAPESNIPSEYADRQHRYYEDETADFNEIYAEYSSDYVEAQIQGLDPADKTAWQTVMLRFSDVVRPSAAIGRKFDDHKLILATYPRIDYIPAGTKIQTMGSTWLAVNPANISASSGLGLVRRCNAVWCSYDYYGNVVSEPICVENERASSNDPDSQEAVMVTKGYFNVIAQYNERTAQINDNTRMILGSKAYRVSGYSDFETEFTGDYGSLRLLYFVVRTDEINAALDDVACRVAGGKAFSWEIVIDGAPVLGAGKSVQMTASSVRCGEQTAGTEEYPIGYVWESSDEGVAAVSEDGMVTGVSDGEAVITARLAQNREIYSSVSVTVAAEGQAAVAFTAEPPAEIAAYGSAVIVAAYMVGGVAGEQTVTWAFSGADDDAFTFEIDGNRATVYAWAGSVTPLTVTASYGGQVAAADIILRGV